MSKGFKQTVSRSFALRIEGKSTLDVMYDESAADVVVLRKDEADDTVLTASQTEALAKALLRASRAKQKAMPEGGEE